MISLPSVAPAQYVSLPSGLALLQMSRPASPTYRSRLERSCKFNRGAGSPHQHRSIRHREECSIREKALR